MLEETENHVDIHRKAVGAATSKPFLTLLPGLEGPRPPLRLPWKAQAKFLL